MPDASESGEPTTKKPAQRPAVAASIWALEHAQDFVTVAVGVVLIVLAATLAVSGVVGFITDVQKQTVATAAIILLDRVLLVLILVEIVHTVVLSLRAHRLAAQPFIVVGLVAVIRRILFLLSNENAIRTAELALLIGMVVAFVAAYLAVSHFEKPEEGLTPDEPARPDPGLPARPDPGLPARPDPGLPARPDPGLPARPDPGLPDLAHPGPALPLPGPAHPGPVSPAPAQPGNSEPTDRV